jgi:hypothetical protein
MCYSDICMMEAMMVEKNTEELRRIQVETLQRAAQIAASEQSPLAVDFWNEACRRIEQLLGAEAAKIEGSLEPGQSWINARSPSL